MSTQPIRIEVARRAAELGWVTKKQADAAIDVATKNATSWGRSGAAVDAVVILTAMGALKSSALSAVESDRPAPGNWWRFWQKPAPGNTERSELIEEVLQVEEGADTLARLWNTHVAEGTSADFNRTLYNIFVKRESCEPDRFGAALIDRYEEPGLRLAAWRVDGDFAGIFLEVDARPQYDLQFHTLFSGAQFGIGERTPSPGRIEIVVQHDGREVFSLANPPVGVDPKQRIKDVTRILFTALTAVGGELERIQG